MSTYTPIASVTLSSAQSSVTFSGIPQTYTDLVLVGQYSFASTGIRYATVRVGNGTLDTGSNYSETYLDTYYGTPNSGRNSSVAQALFSYSSSSGLSTSQFQVAIANFMNYSNTTTYKTIINRNMSANDMVSAYANLWRSTSAINIIEVTAGGANFASGSTFNLYGIDAELSAQAKAYGGDTIVTDGTYWYHTFYSSGTFTPTAALTADYLVVAGGGGGGYSGNDRGAGGGGAGGYRTATSQALTAQAYTVTIGAGGAGGTNNPTQGSNGTTSSFNSTSASGGGGGGSSNTSIASGVAGGSGGGACNTGGTGTNAGGSGNSGSYSPVEGYAGGSAIQNNGGYNGGGGGGSSAAGSAASAYDSTGTAGGAGTANSISGSSVTYATGGRGAGATMTRAAVSGSANTGNGGEGVAQNYTVAAGGSGIVIVRYAV